MHSIPTSPTLSDHTPLNNPDTPVHLTSRVVASDAVREEVLQVRHRDRPDDVGIPPPVLSDKALHRPREQLLTLVHPARHRLALGPVLPPEPHGGGPHRGVHCGFVQLKGLPEQRHGVLRGPDLQDSGAGSLVPAGAHSCHRPDGGGSVGALTPRSPLITGFGGSLCYSVAPTVAPAVLALERLGRWAPRGVFQALNSCFKHQCTRAAVEPGVSGQIAGNGWFWVRACGGAFVARGDSCLTAFGGSLSGRSQSMWRGRSSMGSTF